MQKGVKFRIYPNREQKNLINQTLGCCRLVYNRGLAMREDAFKNGNKIGYSQTSAMLTDLKRSEDFAFLKVVDSIALQQSLRDLELAYKAIWYGNDIIKVPTKYPSSQTCSSCGYKNPLVKNLAIRNWECPDCHTKHDRDTNASINILNKGLQMKSA